MLFTTCKFYQQCWIVILKPQAKAVRIKILPRYNFIQDFEKHFLNSVTWLGSNVGLVN